jgi:hypothetical protein
MATVFLLIEQREHNRNAEGTALFVVDTADTIAARNARAEGRQ